MVPPKNLLSLLQFTFVIFPRTLIISSNNLFEHDTIGVCTMKTKYQEKWDKIASFIFNHADFKSKMYLNSFLSGVQQNHGYPTFTFCDFAFIEKWSYRLYTERLIATQKIKKYFIVILVILSRWKMIGVLQSFKILISPFPAPILFELKNKILISMIKFCNMSAEELDEKQKYQALLLIYCEACTFSSFVTNSEWIH